jgi:hypothetical protein
MVADALSTALYVTPPDRGARLLAAFPDAAALTTRPDGSRHELGGDQRPVSGDARRALLQLSPTTHGPMLNQSRKSLV